jgi:hypothetical protein
MTQRGVAITLVVLAVLCGLAALGGTVSEANQAKLAARAKLTPQRIKVSELSQKGPGDNIYVTVTDFDFAKGDVYVARRRRSREYTHAYFPLTPRGKGLRSSSGPPRVVVMAALSSDGEVEGFMRRKTITGVVTNSWDELDGPVEPQEWRVEGRLP